MSYVSLHKNYINIKVAYVLMTYFLKRYISTFSFHYYCKQGVLQIVMLISNYSFDILIACHGI